MSKKEAYTVIAGDEWLQLRKVGHYTYMHELKRTGTVVILPYRHNSETSSYDVLLRGEVTPCWDLNNPILSSITGGIDHGSSHLETACKELMEETGYEVDLKDMMYLGESFSTKMCDTIYYLYACDLTESVPTKPLHIESVFEQKSFAKWVRESDIHSIQDPFVYACYIRMFGTH